MKISIIKCKTCKRAIAGCNVDDGYPASWYKSLGKYAAAGIWEIEEIDSDGGIFDGSPMNKCCGKKLKT